MKTKRLCASTGTVAILLVWLGTVPLQAALTWWLSPPMAHMRCAATTRELCHGEQ
jgi:hypothetical protein